MGRFSVFGCRMKNSEKYPKVSLHRLPTCKERRKQWLDILGIENLNTTTKYIFICSLHFEENCFNRTLNVTRLRDDALPSGELLLPAQFDKCEEQQFGSRKVMGEIPVCNTSNYTELPAAQFIEYEEQQFVSQKALEEKPACSTSSYADLPIQCNESMEHQFLSHKSLEEKPVCNTSSYANLSAQFDASVEQQFLSQKAQQEQPVCSTSSYADLPAQLTVCEEQQYFPRKIFEERKPFCSTTNYTHVRVIFKCFYTIQS